MIDDPPRLDYVRQTRPQRSWFDPEVLSSRLTPSQLQLAMHLAQGDALLRAAVRADECAQGARLHGNVDTAVRQASLSDSFFDSSSRSKLRRSLPGPPPKSFGASPGSGLWAPCNPRRFRGVPLARSSRATSTSASRGPHQHATPSAHSYPQPLRPRTLTRRACSQELRDYSAGARRTVSELTESRSRRPSAEIRVRG